MGCASQIERNTRSYVDFILEDTQYCRDKLKFLGHLFGHFFPKSFEKCLFFSYYITWRCDAEYAFYNITDDILTEPCSFYFCG